MKIHFYCIGRLAVVALCLVGVQGGTALKKLICINLGKVFK